MDCEKTEEKQGQIFNYMGRLENLIKESANTQASLSNRLVTIIGPESPETEAEEGKSEIETELAPLANKLRAYCNAMVSINSDYGNLLARIQL